MSKRIICKRIAALIQVIVATVLTLMAGMTLINLGLILARPETISVVNTLIGQGVLIICLLVIGRVLFTKGLAGLRQAKPVANADSTD